MYEISLSKGDIWDISSSISLLNRDMRYLSLFWDVCERLLYLREMCEISLFRGNLRDIFLSREIYEISLCQERYMRSFTIKGDVWDILLLDRDTWYPHIKNYIWDRFLLREICEISLYIEKVTWDISLFKRGVWDLLI